MGLEPLICILRTCKNLHVENVGSLAARNIENDKVMSYPQCDLPSAAADCRSFAC
jgi:hypothetical protein